MHLTFEATKDYYRLLSDVDTLITFAKDELEKGNDNNRTLFLKLSVVTLVIRFQVFVESVLKEYHYTLKEAGKLHNILPIHLRLNSLRIFTSEKIIHKTLENHEAYNQTKLEEIKNLVKKTSDLCNDNLPISSDFQFETKFLLGKTGLNELIKLFRQIDGENIFISPPFDPNKINEILGRRHAIVHEDANQLLTEEVVEDYRDIMKSVVSYLDVYLFQKL